MARSRSGLTLFALALVATILVACGGGGGSSALPATGGGGAAVPTPVPANPTPVPAPTSTPTQSTSSQTVLAGAQPAPVSLPAISTGVSFSATLPAASSGSGNVIAQLSATKPSGPVLQLARRAPSGAGFANVHAVRPVDAIERIPSAIGATSLTALGYVAFTPSANLTFPSMPAMTFSIPSGTSAPNGFWLAVYDPTNPNAGWSVVAGPVSASGTTVTFPAQSQPFALHVAQTTVIVMFAPGGTYPTPVSTVAPTPLPTPTGSSVACSDADRAPLAGPRRRGAASQGTSVVPNELYVTYRQSAGRSVESIARGVESVSVSSLGGESGVAHAVVRLAAGSDARQAESTLRANADVVSVAPLHYRHVLSCTASANDGLFNTSDQWYLYRTSVAGSGTNGWSLSHGRGISVAVLDTGADLTNQDLAPKITFQESVVGGVTSTASGAAQDTNGHGTNVAGLVAAATNNSYGFASIGWEVNLMVYRIFPPATALSDSQSADTADEAIAIRDAVARGASIVSMSLGASNYNNAGFDQAEYDAVEYAISQGVTVVAAAGNEYGTAPNTDGSVPDSPGGYTGVIAVGASGVQDATPNNYASITTESPASYSNSGAALLAPGGDPPTNDTGKDMLLWIEGYSTTTAAFTADQCTNTGGVCRALFAGTSQATPQVSAAIALMQALKGGPRSLTPAQALSILQQSTDALPGVSPSRQGAGRLNVLKALQNTH